MKTKQLIETLSDLNQLREIQLEEIADLKAKYPFCQNLHFLEAKKMQLLGDTNNLSKFQSLTAILPDSANLYNRFAHSECEPDSKDYDAPELNQLIHQELFPSESHALSQNDLVKEDPILTDNESRNEKITEAGTDVETSLKNLIAEDNDIVYLEVKKRKKRKKKGKTLQSPQAESKKKKKSKKKIKKKAVSIESRHDPINKKSKKIKTIKPTKKNKPILPSSKETIKDDSFESWLLSLKGTPHISQENPDVGDIELQAAEALEPQKKSKKKAPKGTRVEKKSKSKKKKSKKKGKKLQTKIDSSLERKSMIVSETLAEMMANQGHIKQAIDIYNQLILLYPEKSGYFAAQIKKLD